MIREIVGWALGPTGELILQWYTEHNLFINGPIVVLALLSILFPNQRRRFQDFCLHVWQRSPLGATAEERAAHQRAKNRQQETRGKNREAHKQ
jgi:hypothetical protein